MLPMEALSHRTFPFFLNYHAVEAGDVYVSYAANDWNLLVWHVIHALCKCTCGFCAAENWLTTSLSFSARWDLMKAMLTYVNVKHYLCAAQSTNCCTGSCSSHDITWHHMRCHGNTGISHPNVLYTLGSAYVNETDMSQHSVWFLH